jgi:hypothetical protein
MNDETICFEKAALSDLGSIWRLLHADSKMLQEEEILAQINNLYILRHRQRILGVLCGNYTSGGKVTIHWVVIHPLYLKKALREAMIREYTAILCREPETPKKMDNILSRWIKGSTAQLPYDKETQKSLLEIS